MQLISKALNKIRLLLDLKGLKNRYLLLKNGSDLNKEEQKNFNQILNYSPCLSIAYELKEELRDIYQTSSTVKQGYRKFRKWLYQITKYSLHIKHLQYSNVQSS